MRKLRELWDASVEWVLYHPMWVICIAFLAVGLCAYFFDWKVAPNRVKRCCAWERYDSFCTETGVAMSTSGKTSTVVLTVPCVEKRCTLYVVNYRQDDGTFTGHTCPVKRDDW